MQIDGQNRITRMWREWRPLIVFLVLMVMFRSALADWNTIPSESMKPTILIGDRVVVNKIAYGLRVPFTSTHVATWAHPERGEIVTFYSPLDEQLLIKRVAALPGDDVEMQNNRLIINGERAHYAPLQESAHAHLSQPQRGSYKLLNESIQGSDRRVMMLNGSANDYNSFGPIRVPEEHYLMLGDNRDQSADSRRIGFVHRERITGRAHTVAFSLDYDGWYLPRLDRFVEPLR